ncbi:MAG: hypothetical protein ABS938_02385 [Psychrobacillus psychrodurans]
MNYDASPKEERKIISNYIADKLLSVFRTGEYILEEDLQVDFQQLNSKLKQYHAILDRLLKDNPLNIQLTWRDIKIPSKRWHLCKICNWPFISYDCFNKIQICTRQQYTRFNVSTKEYYKSTGIRDLLQRYW